MSAKEKRQSMAEALERGTEVLAFLEEGKPKPAKERATPKKPPSKAKRAEQPTRKRTPKKAPSPPPEEKGEVDREPAQNIDRTPMTFRIPTELAERIKRASLTRKLSKSEPSSQLDIAEEAFEDWLAKAGE